MKTENRKTVLDFLDNIVIDNVNLLDFIEENDITKSTTFDHLTEILEDNNALDVEIIYYSKAINFLKENDPSLKDSLTLAYELGYSPQDLNSEILASILASDIARENWYEFEHKVTDLLGSLDWSE